MMRDNLGLPAISAFVDGRQNDAENQPATVGATI